MKMKKWVTTSVALLTSVTLLAACNSNTGEKKTASANVTKTSSKEDNTVKKETAKMQKQVTALQTAISKKNDADVKKIAKEINDHWLAYENNVRDLYPLNYTDVEKYEMPIFEATSDNKLNYDDLDKQAKSLQGALKDLQNAKETKAKTSVVLNKAVKQYQSYVEDETNALVTNTQQFADAVKNNDIEKAKDHYAAARVYYERIEPIAESFGDLDPKIDARINDVDKVSDWTGFHEIERSIWEKNTLEGQGKYADQLMKDVKDLQNKVKTLKLEPKTMVAGSMELLNEAATTKITGEEERYSHIDLVDLDANVEGSKAVYQAIIPALNVNHKQLAQQLDSQFVKIENTLATYKKNDNYVSYKSLSKEDIRKLSDELSQLSNLMSQTAKLF
ncbi:iron uptake system protein EfeO [Heyndrickxia ginsengihumi]|nr:iron uptake system protein EfeO [Heyndrickxia ginsengihumi]MCM3022101.1 Efem/EfeO family lipoprotein [Heyndrickxia ginsengihumi]